KLTWYQIYSRRTLSLKLTEMADSCSHHLSRLSCNIISCLQVAYHGLPNESMWNASVKYFQDLSMSKSPRGTSTPVNNLISTLANPGTATSKPFNTAMARSIFV